VIFTNPIMGHRGAAGLAPENTLLAINAGATNGASAVEIDVTLLADQTVVVHHDDKLGRCMDGAGELAKVRYSDLTTVHAKGVTPASADCQIPTLAEVLERIDMLGIGINVEIKNHGFEAGFLAEKVLAVLNQWGHTGNCIISSFDLAVLKEIRLHHPEWRLGWITDTLPKDWADIAKDNSLYSIHLSEKAVTETWIDEARALGVYTFVWTVNDAPIARKFLEWGVDGIITDYPDRMPSHWQN
jgi:glycerophosphoryl diester phosphodiesterase